jgi:hypothetical protein
LVGDVRVGPWSAPGTAPSGCCFPMRPIEVDVVASDVDPWAWTGVVALAKDGSPLDLNQPYTDALVGPGSATLTLLQWFDEEQQTLSAACFDIVGVSASGVAGPPETICVEDDLPSGPPLGDTGVDVGALRDQVGPDGLGCGGGCATGADPAAVLVTILTLVVARTRRRPSLPVLTRAHTKV